MQTKNQVNWAFRAYKIQAIRHGKNSYFFCFNGHYSPATNAKIVQDFSFFNFKRAQKAVKHFDVVNNEMKCA